MINELKQIKLKSKSPKKKPQKSMRICCNNFIEYEYLFNEIEASKRKRDFLSPQTRTTTQKDVMSNRTKKTTSINNLNFSTNPTQNQTKDNIVITPKPIANDINDIEVEYEIPEPSLAKVSMIKKNSSEHVLKSCSSKQKNVISQSLKNINEVTSDSSNRKRVNTNRETNPPKKKVVLKKEIKNKMLFQSNSFAIKKESIPTFSSEPQTIDANTNKLIREKIRKEYIASISKEHCQTKEMLKQEKDLAHKNYEINLKTLEGWAHQIKKNGFEKHEKAIKEKQLKYSKLCNSVKIINSKLGNKSKEERHLSSHKGKYYHENVSNQCKIERLKEENETFAKEINQIKKETPNYLPQIEKTKEETRIINEQIIIETNEISQLKSDIQVINKSISDITKEKDNLLSALHFMNKQNEVLRARINEQYNKSTNFLLNVDELLVEQNLFTK